MKKSTEVDLFSLWIIAIGVVSLIVEKSVYHFYGTIVLTHVLDYLIFSLYIIDLMFAYFKAESKWTFLNTHFVQLLVLGIVAYFFIVSKMDLALFPDTFEGVNLSIRIIVVMTIFNTLRAVTRLKKMSQFIANFASNPAQTIIVSFASIILTGTIFLMMPFSTVSEGSLSLINAFFTATSATCVTGLTVVDTGTTYTLFGQVVILGMIQAGGLGIMILSYFTAFIVGKRISIHDKMTLSYMLNERDVTSIRFAIHRIIGITLLIELTGMVFIWLGLSGGKTISLSQLYYAFFHAVSAFCNAGFSLESSGLMVYQHNYVMLMIVAVLIILGGLSFSVVTNVFVHVKSALRVYVFKKEDRVYRLSLNTKIVTRLTLALLASATLLIYIFEHGNTLFPLSIGKQYLNAFFQAVTLRTAGFNSIDFSRLTAPTYILMMFYMFIGGASGSTAGGVKVNTLGVIYAYIKSMFSRHNEVVIMKQSLSFKLVNQAFSVIFFALMILFLSTLLLSITELDKRFSELLFEVVSAFGTVGLSMGITPHLTDFGKTVIICVMFIGRLGPLTLIAALSHSRRTIAVKYPEEEVTIG